MKIPIRYLPKRLSKKDKKRQISMLAKSRKLYKQGNYYTRKRLPSFHSKPSSHVTTAKNMYKVDKISANRELAKATGCSLSALQKIVKKGQGAYFSSGSRPNQTAQSWGNARLASSVTGGKAAAVDFSILEQGCQHNKRAYLLAKKAKQKYGHGHSSAKRINV